MPPVTDDTPLVEMVRFDSDAYWLEGDLTYPDRGWPTGGVVIAGPHPLLGGTMRNQVVHSLALGLARRGQVALSFNYRGTGASEGPAAERVENLADFWATSHTRDEAGYGVDVTHAVAFLRGVVGPRVSLALVGYSFGCSLLPHAAEDHSPLVLIGPTFGTHDYGPFLAGIRPVLVIVSEDDFAVDGQQLQSWFDELRGPKQLLRGRFDNHFFRGHESWLVEQVGSFLAAAGRTIE